MQIKNFEFKAKVNDPEIYEHKLLTLNPVFHGEDCQTDTYFNVRHGRLKLREGQIENALINYDREDLPGAKASHVILYKHMPDNALKSILELQLGIKAVVVKKRKIYYKDNVKFHFDTVDNLGTFIEVEAIDDKDQFDIEELKQQCSYYYHFFQLSDNDIVDRSYSDLLLELSEKS